MADHPRIPTRFWESARRRGQVFNGSKVHFVAAPQDPNFLLPAQTPAGAGKESFVRHAS